MSSRLPLDIKLISNIVKKADVLLWNERSKAKLTDGHIAGAFVVELRSQYGLDVYLVSLWFRN